MVPAEAAKCEVWHRVSKPSAAGARGSAVLYVHVDNVEPGPLLLEVHLDDPTAAAADAMAMAPMASMASMASPAVMASMASGMGGALDLTTAPRVEPAAVRLTLTTGLAFYSENPFVSRALLDRQWTEMHDPSTGTCPPHLVWTVKSADVDFKNLQRGALCNHFEPLPLTTKVGLIECLREGAKWHGDVKSEAIFPRSYDLSDDEQLKAFTGDFYLTAASAVLKRFVAYGPAPTPPHPSLAKPKQ